MATVRAPKPFRLVAHKGLWEVGPHRQFRYLFASNAVGLFFRYGIRVRALQSPSRSAQETARRYLAVGSFMIRVISRIRGDWLELTRFRGQ
jgi:hypothetical protein